MRLQNQEAGLLWMQRLNQHLVANGIAVVELNPYGEDSMDAYVINKRKEGYFFPVVLLIKSAS